MITEPQQEEAVVSTQLWTLGKPIAVKLDFDITVSKLIKELEAEGFVIANNIDVRQLIEDTTRVRIRPFVCLSIYHPDIVKRMVDDKPESMIWFPWCVRVQSVGGKTQFTMPDPVEMVSFVAEDSKWRSITSDLIGKFDKVYEAFGDTLMKK